MSINKKSIKVIRIVTGFRILLQSNMTWFYEQYAMNKVQ